MIEYKEIEGVPDEKAFEKIKQFCLTIFTPFDIKELEKRFSEATDLLINMALDDKKLSVSKSAIKSIRQNFTVGSAVLMKIIEIKKSRRS